MSPLFRFVVVSAFVCGDGGGRIAGFSAVFCIYENSSPPRPDSLLSLFLRRVGLGQQLPSRCGGVSMEAERYQHTHNSESPNNTFLSYYKYLDFFFVFFSFQCRKKVGLLKERNDVKSRERGLCCWPSFFTPAESQEIGCWFDSTYIYQYIRRMYIYVGYM